MFFPPSVKRLLAFERGMLVVATAALVFFLLLLVRAFAAESTTVDLGPTAVTLIQWLGPVVIVAFVVFGGWLAMRLFRLAGLKENALQRAVVEAGMEKAASFALTKLRDFAIGGIPVNLKSEAVALIVSYAQKQFPGALKHFAKSPEDLAQMAEARLEGILVDPEIEASAGVRSVRGSLIAGT
ncbi:MAG: hypothetical protein DI629_03525 [Mesorhizobium amorphae]|nr:MAG: hypothetical protein DI629_03525 [Mesorhizobium amorphae]